MLSDSYDDFTDVRLTPTMRDYLGAFDDFLLAPTVDERRYARSAMGELRDRMLGEAGLSRDEREALSSEDLRL